MSLVDYTKNSNDFEANEEDDFDYTEDYALEGSNYEVEEDKSFESESLEDNFDPLSVKIVLVETCSIMLFGAPCLVVPAHTAEGIKAEEDNNLYRKKSTQSRVIKKTGTQTEMTLASTRGTCHSLPPVDDLSTFVNVRLLYEHSDSFDEKEEPLPSGSWFHDELIETLERVLVSNHERPLPLRTKILDVDPEEPTVQFLYNPKILCELACEDLRGFHVSAVSSNPLFHHILAAGYGIAEMGKIALWSLKNTHGPERLYCVEAPVSSMSFSKMAPNMLAVGFSTGHLKVLDVSSVNLKVLHSFTGRSHVAIRQVQWWPRMSQQEQIIFASGNKISRLRIPFSAPKKIMATSHLTTQGSRMGVVQGWGEAPLTAGPTVTALLSFPPELYILGAADGYIRLCSIHSIHRRLEKAFAHLGIVTVVKACPHCEKIFLTAGTDGCVSIWALHIATPLVTLTSGDVLDTVLDAVWSPKHATVIAGITNAGLYFWDLKRKGLEPASMSPLSHRPINIEFSASGDYLIVGTKSGTIYLVGLEAMPFPERNKKVVCTWAILRHLQRAGHDQLLKQIKHCHTFE